VRGRPSAGKHFLILDSEPFRPACARTPSSKSGSWQHVAGWRGCYGFSIQAELCWVKPMCG
jgi:hypothetical protein